MPLGIAEGREGLGFGLRGLGASHLHVGVEVASCICSGNGGVGLGNYFFLSSVANYPYGRGEGLRPRIGLLSINTDESVSSAPWHLSLAEPSWLLSHAW